MLQVIATFLTCYILSFVSGYILVTNVFEQLEKLTEEKNE